MVRILPTQEKRVETGVTQFGDDWPGIFIRGDDAFHYAQCIKAMLGGGETEMDAIYRGYCRGIVGLLESSNVHAKVIEARSGETSGSTEGESAVGETDLP